MTVLIETLGWIGSGLCLSAYLLTSIGKLSGDSALFQTMNFIGGTTLAINVIWHQAWPAAVLEVCWALIGLVALIQIARRRSA